MRSVAISFVTTAAMQLLNVLTGVLAARFLLPEGRGELAAILLWPSMIGGVLYMSVDHAVAYYGASQSGAARRFCAVAMLAAAPLALLAMSAGYVILPLLMHAYNADIVAISRLYLLSIPFSYAGMVILGTLQGLQKFSVWNVVRLMPSIGYVVVILLFVAFGAATVRGFALASLTASILTTLTGLWLLFRARGLPGRPTRRDFLQLAHYSVGVHLPGLAALANQQLDRVLVALFLAPEVLGVYVVALSAVEIVRMMGGTIGPIAFARVAYQSDPVDRLRRFGRYFRLTLAITGVAAFVLALAGKWLIILVFGEAFALAGDLLPLLLVGSFAHTMKHSLYFGLKAYAKLRAISVGEFLSFAAQAAVLLILLPRIGPMGAAWAVALSGLVGMTVAAVAMTSITQFNVLRMAVPLPEDFRYLRQKVLAGRRLLADF